MKIKIAIIYQDELTPENIIKVEVVNDKVDLDDFRGYFDMLTANNSAEKFDIVMFEVPISALLDEENV